MKTIKNRIKHLNKRLNTVCKSKTGSTLLMVVMTMSIMIIIGSSMLMMTFNTNMQSIFASSQVKAEQSALSVVNGIRNSPTVLTKMIEQYGTTLHAQGDTVTFTAQSSVAGKLSGTNTITLSVEESVQNSPVVVGITVLSVVGKSRETIKFTARLNNNSAHDIINAVTNSTAANGGSVNFSFPTSGVNGDVSLYGNYLLALFDGGDDDLGATEINGSVFCNGSLIIGAKVWASNHYNALHTTIKGNVSVNGDLIINACEIEGDVYVAGNILLNGYVNGTATIKGNVYCGGSIYVTSTPFARYSTTDNKNGNSEFKLIPSNFPGRSFPAFPTLDEIKANSKLITDIYNKSIVSLTKGADDFSDYTATYGNLTQKTISTNIGDIQATHFTASNGVNVGGEMGGQSAFYHRKVGSKWYYIVRNWALGDTWDAWGTNHSVGSADRTYNTLEVVSGRSNTDAGYCNGKEKTFITEVVTPYLTQKVDGTYARFTYELIKQTACVVYNSLTIQGNIYTQKDAYIEANNSLATYNGKSFYVGGNFDFLGVASTCDEGNNGSTAQGKGTFTATKLFVGGTTTAKAVEAKVAFSHSKSFYAYVVVEQNFDGQGSKVRSWWDTDSGDADFNYKGYFYISETVVNSFADYGFNQSVYGKAVNTSTNAIAESAIAESGLARMKVYCNQTYAMWTKSVSISPSAIASGTLGTVLENIAITPTISAKTMFTETLIKQGANLPDSQKKVNPTTALAVFKEMGVFGVNVGINDNTYKSGKIYVSGTTGTTIYEATGNKINDAEGTNFTGVAIAQIRFASTLSRALACDTVVTSKAGLIQKLKEISKPDNEAALFSQVAALRAAWELGQQTEYVGIRYVEDEGWHAGVVAKAHKERYIIMRDVYIDGATDLVFGDNSGKSTNAWDLTEHFLVDTGSGDVNVYIRPTGTFKYNKDAVNGYNGFALQCSVLESYKMSGDSGKQGVAYVYMIPAFFKGDSETEMNSTQLREEIDYMYGAVPQVGKTNVYKSLVADTGGVYRTYRYTGAYTTTANVLKTPAIENNYSTRYNTHIYITSNQGTNSGIRMRKQSYIFVVSEGPTEVWVGDQCNINCILYTPHKGSKVIFGHKEAYGTGEGVDDTSIHENGGALITGEIVMDWEGANGRDWYIDSEFNMIPGDTDFLSDKLQEGVSTIQVQTDEETTRSWLFSNFS